MRQATTGMMEILLVEDNPEDAQMTIDALRQKEVPCRVHLARDGEEGLNFLRRWDAFADAPQPDLILLDMELPKKSGQRLLVEIRADERLKEIPVLVLTACRVYKAALEAQALHVDGFMTKPVSWEQFIHVVRSLRRSWLEAFPLQWHTALAQEARTT
jgi:two-component system, chemotaxis family, response regulator Rcp1